MIIPPKLQPGAHVRVVSPAGPCEPELLEAGLEALREMGYEPSESEGARARRRYLAGSVERRLRDIEEALSDDGVDALWCNRGGFGSTQLLDRLGERFCDKWCVGLSDITALHQLRLSAGGVEHPHRAGRGRQSSGKGDRWKDLRLEIDRRRSRVHLAGR